VNSVSGERAAHSDQGRRRASGIYGTILTAAVIAAGGNTLTTAELEVTVLVTLVVYWVAEQYAELLGEHTSEGRLPGAAQIRASFVSSFSMVSASFVPLISLLVARALGANELGAAMLALVICLILLVYHGYSAGRAAGLKGFMLFGATATAALFGVAMIVLKTLLQHQHHLY
jgi:hypothetical protein